MFQRSATMCHSGAQKCTRRRIAFVLPFSYAESTNEDNTNKDRRWMTMDGALFMLATGIIEGGLVLLIMWVFTSPDREANREEEIRRQLSELEAKEEQLSRKAA